MKKIICSNSKTLPSSRLLGVLSAGIICFSASLLHAQTTAGLIDVQFTGNQSAQHTAVAVPDPGPTQSGAALIGSAGDIWNAFNNSYFTFSAFPNRPASASGLALDYANGSPSGVSMSLTASTTYNAQSFGNHSPFVTVNSPYQNLMQVYCNRASSYKPVSLSGLAPNATFNLILYNAGDNNVLRLAAQALLRSTVLPRPVFGMALPAHWWQVLIMSIIRQPRPMVRATWLSTMGDPRHW